MFPFLANPVVSEEFKKSLLVHFTTSFDVKLLKPDLR